MLSSPSLSSLQTRPRSSSLLVGSSLRTSLLRLFPPRQFRKRRRRRHSRQPGIPLKLPTPSLHPSPLTFAFVRGPVPVPVPVRVPRPGTAATLSPQSPSPRLELLSSSNTLLLHHPERPIRYPFIPPHSFLSISSPHTHTHTHTHTYPTTAIQTLFSRVQIELESGHHVILLNLRGMTQGCGIVLGEEERVEEEVEEEEEGEETEEEVGFGLLSLLFELVLKKQSVSQDGNEGESENVSNDETNANAHLFESDSVFLNGCWLGPYEADTSEIQALSDPQIDTIQKAKTVLSQIRKEYRQRLRNSLRLFHSSSLCLNLFLLKKDKQSTEVSVRILICNAPNNALHSNVCKDIIWRKQPSQQGHHGRELDVSSHPQGHVFERLMSGLLDQYARAVSRVVVVGEVDGTGTGSASIDDDRLVLELCRASMKKCERWNEMRRVLCDGSGSGSGSDCGSGSVVDGRVRDIVECIVDQLKEIRGSVMPDVEKENATTTTKNLRSVVNELQGMIQGMVPQLKKTVQDVKTEIQSQGLTSGAASRSRRSIELDPDDLDLDDEDEDEPVVPASVVQAQLQKFGAYYDEQLKKQNEIMLAMQSDYDLLEKEYEKLRLQCEKLELENRSLKEADPERASLLIDEEKERLEDEIDRLNDLLDSRPDAEETAEEMETLRENKEKLEEKVEHLEETNQELSDSLRILQVDLETERENCDRIKGVALQGGGAEQWRKLLDENQSLKATAARMTDAAQASERKFGDLKRELDDVRAEKDAIVDRHRLLDDEREQSEPGTSSEDVLQDSESIRRLNDEVADLREHLAASDAELESKSKEISDLLSALDEKGDEEDLAIEREKKQKRELSSMAQKLSMHEAEYVEQVQQLEAENGAMRDTLKALRMRESDSVRTLEGQKQNLVEEVAVYRKENSQLSRKTKRLRAVVDRLREENAQNKQAIQMSLVKLNRQLTNIKKENGRYQYLEKERGRRSALKLLRLKQLHEEEIQKVESQLKRELFFKIKDLQQKTEQIDEMSVTVKKLQSDVQSRDSTILSLREECEEAKSKFQHLSNSRIIHKRLLQVSPPRNASAQDEQTIPQLRAKVRFLQEKVFESQVQQSKLKKLSEDSISVPPSLEQERRRMMASIQRLVIHVERHKIERRKFRNRCDLLERIISTKNAQLAKIKGMQGVGVGPKEGVWHSLEKTALAEDD